MDQPNTFSKIYSIKIEKYICSNCIPTFFISYSYTVGFAIKSLDKKECTFMLGYRDLYKYISVKKVSPCKIWCVCLGSREILSLFIVLEAKKCIAKIIQFPSNNLVS